jgi:glycosyltransferase involved in cell wall biosynthesis
VKTILICTDAWEPQVSGVVRCLQETIKHLEPNYRVEVLHPNLFPTIPCPFYPEITLAHHIPTSTIEQHVQRANTIHIATEGPIGLKCRNYCHKKGIPFTTAYHTNFPETINRIAKIPRFATYSFLRWFHKPATKLMVTTETNKAQLKARKFKNDIVIWKKGVNTELFRPLNQPKQHTALYVGRLSKEKNVEAFLQTNTPLQKVIVGDGPLRNYLQKKYPQAQYHGYLTGEALVQAYNQARVFVFPSRAETFGLVMIEALACGTPVAAYPAPGPIDAITKLEYGCLSHDLNKAIDAATIFGKPQACREYALTYDWQNCTKQFTEELIWI